MHIHFEVRGEGPPLVLMHGFAGRLESWQLAGYVTALEATHRLILVDGRGHGRSDKPHDPEAYDLALRAGDVVAVLDALGIERAAYVGYSLGGWIGYGLMHHAPGRVSALALGGAHAFRDATWEAFRAVDPKDGAAFLAALEAVIGERLPPATHPLILANDLEALVASAQARPSLEAVLPAIAVPCLLYAGDADPRHAAVRDCATHVPGATFVSLPGLTHLGAFLRSDMVLPRLSRFLVG